MQLRQKIEVVVLLALIFLTFASYHQGTGSVLWLQWLTIVTMAAFVFVFDMAFLDESGFIFDPDADNWRRKTVSGGILRRCCGAGRTEQRHKACGVLTDFDLAFNRKQLGAKCFHENTLTVPNENVEPTTANYYFDYRFPLSILFRSILRLVVKESRSTSRTCISISHNNLAR